MSWEDLGKKTWGEIGGEARIDHTFGAVPVSEDIQKTLDGLRADVETLKARVGQVEAAMIEPHTHCWHAQSETQQRGAHELCCWCAGVSALGLEPMLMCYGHPREGHGQYAEHEPGEIVVESR